MSIDISHVGFELSRDERETIISRAEDQDAWCVTTFSPAFARKLLRLHEKRPFPIEKYGRSGVRCFLPLKSVSLRALLEISPEIKAQRAAAFRERLNAKAAAHDDD